MIEEYLKNLGARVNAVLLHCNVSNSGKVMQHFLTDLADLQDIANFVPYLSALTSVLVVNKVDTCKGELCLSTYKPMASSFPPACVVTKY